MQYLEGPPQPRADECLFCERIARPPAPDTLIAYRGPQDVVFMNKFPYNNGHLLVMPLRHLAELDELTPDELLSLFDTVRLSRRALCRVMDPHGFNIGLNLGQVAGAGVPGHLHVHIVPRWDGDTNFMPVLADTKVMPEHLAVTREKLASAFAELAAASGGRGK